MWQAKSPRLDFFSRLEKGAVASHLILIHLIWIHHLTAATSQATMQSNDNLPVAEAVGGTYAGLLQESYILPSTKVPALHPFHTDASDERSHGSIRRLSLRGIESSGKRDVADDVRKYAKAVMAFTGLDDIAFRLVINEWKGIVHAVAEEGPLSTSVKVFGLNSATDQQVSAHTDFVLHFNTSKQDQEWRDDRVS